MADKTFYRYIDSNGDAHFADVASEIPTDHKGVIEKLTVQRSPLTAKAVGVAEEAVETMHWPSFAWGLGVAAVGLIVMRIFSARRFVFIGAAAAVAASGFGAAGYLQRIKRALPSSVANAIPSAADLKSAGTSAAEARRILESLPKASADRDKALEAILGGEKR